MAGDATEFFYELLFGTGAYLGAILIVSIIVITTMRYRMSATIFMPICIFLGIQYFTTVSVSSDLTWIGILMFVMAIYCLGMLINGIKKVL